MYPRLCPSPDRRNQGPTENGPGAARFFTIFASQTLLLSLLFVRAIRFSTDAFLPDVTPPHLERWDFAIIRIRDAPSHVRFSGPPENSGTKGGGHEGQV